MSKGRRKGQEQRSALETGAVNATLNSLQDAGEGGLRWWFIVFESFWGVLPEWLTYSMQQRPVNREQGRDKILEVDCCVLATTIAVNSWVTKRGRLLPPCQSAPHCSISEQIAGPRTASSCWGNLPRLQGLFRGSSEAWIPISSTFCCHGRVQGWSYLDIKETHTSSGNKGHVFFYHKEKILEASTVQEARESPAGKQIKKSLFINLLKRDHAK